mmetsp:Transcript_84018/g.242885  ORF Transcript_84018/g.242885 Transcript_84018/m.242885 type:complete len:276 (-) Transcript_84018:292-1119(-)
MSSSRLASSTRSSRGFARTLLSPLFRFAVLAACAAATRCSMAAARQVTKEAKARAPSATSSDLPSVKSNCRPFASDSRFLAASCSFAMRNCSWNASAASSAFRRASSPSEAAARRASFSAAARAVSTDHARRHKPRTQIWKISSWHRSAVPLAFTKLPSAFNTLISKSLLDADGCVCGAGEKAELAWAARVKFFGVVSSSHSCSPIRLGKLNLRAPGLVGLMELATDNGVPLAGEPCAELVVGRPRLLAERFVALCNDNAMRIRCMFASWAPVTV